MQMNPVQAIREARGLGRTQFGLALGVTHNQLQGIETGRIRTLGRAAAGLARIGEDPESVAADLAKWLAAQGERILETEQPRAPFNKALSRL